MIVNSLIVLAIPCIYSLETGACVPRSVDALRVRLSQRLLAQRLVRACVAAARLVVASVDLACGGCMPHPLDDAQEMGAGLAVVIDAEGLGLVAQEAVRWWVSGRVLDQDAVG
jgi:hypothetical protein